MAGAGVLVLLFNLDQDDPRTRLYEVNLAITTAVVFLGLGIVLLVESASALGNVSSSPVRLRWTLFLLPFFVPAVLAGQYLARHPGRADWLFGVLNTAVVSIPSIAVAALVLWRYRRRNPLSWPVSWRESVSGFAYGAVGATTVAGIINTLYIGLMGALLVSLHGRDTGSFADDLTTLPRSWGVFLDVTTLSVVAPLNEEFLKGMLVGLFFFRRGGAARCFAWGVLAGAGFNLLETYNNSIGLLDPDVAAEQEIGSQWWLFATARGGTAAMHGLASGFSALGIYGLLHGRPRYLLGYLVGIGFHASWNFLVYLVQGDAFFSQQGWDNRALDIIGVGGLIAEVVLTLALLWYMPGRLRDGEPAHVYRLIGMLPARASPAPG
ncbi:MAG: PrsW family intramembrane metalloprotease [Dehalococcoidia bacterium]|nr:PrsW family intramembrane metalloprotease [Dehalococcoidia bacterium]